MSSILLGKENIESVNLRFFVRRQRNLKRKNHEESTFYTNRYQRYLTYHKNNNLDIRYFVSENYS